MTSKEAILKIRSTLEEGTVEDLVTQWCNATGVVVTDAGDVWVASPGIGRWLDGESLAEFVTWCHAQ